MKVVIVSHNPEWKAKFAEIENKLQVLLRNVPIVAIEHVGSTAIPGLKAKPVIDIDVVVHAASLDSARVALAAGGYTDCGEMNIPGRFACREDNLLRDEYSQLKSELQEREFNDIGQYVTAKSDMLCRILQKAGWDSEDLQSVMDVNK
jgi:GrpB-like predicted nucleotidyltransferase (UPF0157 family)